MIKVLPITIFVACSTLLTHCGGKESEQSKGAPVKYALERQYTNEKSNALIFESEEAEGYLYSISGSGFRADVEKDKKHLVKDRVELTYDHLGSYNLTLKVYQGDGTVLLEDHLSWEYKQREAPLPIVGFTEAATKDDQIVFLVSGSRGPETEELWIQGDLKENSAGQWYKVPDSGMIPLEVTESDGVKTFNIKHRNVYGDESALERISILKKSQKPTQCKILAKGPQTASDQIEIKISGKDSGNLYYRVIGDVDKIEDFKKFDNVIKTSISLSAGDEQKRLIVQIKDIAENYCPSTTINVTRNKDYQGEWIRIEGEPRWTDSSFVTLELGYDYYSDEVAEVYISGGVKSAANVKTWIPFAGKIDVELSPQEGTRFVRVKFRDEDGFETEEYSVPVYLKPFVRLKQILGVDYVTVSNIIGLESVTITGCTQIYNNVDYASKYPCTENGDGVEATFYFEDGETLHRTL